MELGKVKYGVDKRLEEEANEWLKRDVKGNKRGVSRDVEKMRHEAGLISPEELQHYDPSNNWDTQDSAFAINVSPDEIAYIEPSVCDDGNVRSENRIRVENGETYREPSRQDLTQHIEDDDDWGSTAEDIPPLGVNRIEPGTSKVCSYCKLRKRLEYFSPDPRGKYGCDGWCKKCRMGQKRDYRRSESFGVPTDNEGGYKP